MISLTERFENMTETEGVDIIKELPQAQLYEAKTKIDNLQSLNCALETENMELKNQVTRLIKDNYELAQCLKSFTEDDLKSQRRLDLAPQPSEPGSVHVPPADGHEEQKRENKADQKILTYPPSSKKLKQSTQTCAQQQQPKSNKQQQANRIRQQQQPTKKQDQVEKIERSKEQARPTIIIAGDSMVRNMKGWLMSRRKSVKVQTFPGANTDEMEIFIKPLINRNPQHLVLHCGTNNLAYKDPEDVAGNIIGMVQEIKKTWYWLLCLHFDHP